MTPTCTCACVPDLFLMAVASLSSFMGTTTKHKMLQEWFEDLNSESEVLIQLPNPLCIWTLSIGPGQMEIDTTTLQGSCGVQVPAGQGCFSNKERGNISQKVLILTMCDLCIYTFCSDKPLWTKKQARQTLFEHLSPSKYISYCLNIFFLWLAGLRFTTLLC